ncbi:SIR2 family protein [Bradyrhizobium lablabi]|uniref:VMAP-C domain-containing protein n=1 Tax=Bradyrhizobium lablabi TaxID=722472 RepID=UPI001BA70434|nr:SIR2 family protein [Bradyrhizobium lablabi]MBR1124950.1 SIR2 family protein [Bradyrhizobium lablabi]
MFQPPDSLIQAVRDRTLIPFVGAGISVGTVISLPREQRFPDWLGLIELLAARLDREDPAAAARVRAALPDTMMAAQLAVDGLGRRLFLDEIRKAFERSRAPVGANLSAVQAIWRLQAPFIITTNYDKVLEWPWGPGEVEKIHNDDPTPLGNLNTPSGRRRVWHLHGSIDRVDTIILTSEQYLRLYPNENDPKRIVYQNAFEQFKGLLKTNPFLFVGFSLTEPVLRKKLDEVMELTERTAPTKYLLLRAGEADDAKKQDFMDRYNVQVVEFADFGDPMVAAIDAIGPGAERARRVVAGAELTPDMRALVSTLFDQIDGLAMAPQTIARIYNMTKPQAWTFALTGGDGMALLRDAIVQLGGAIGRSGDGVPPLLDFVHRLKHEVGEPWLTRLRDWLDEAVTQLAPTEAARAVLVQWLSERAAPGARERVHVLVRIRTDPKGTDDWIVHAWCWTGTRVPESLFGVEGRRFKDKASGDIVYDLVEELEARRTDPDVTSISFIVPSVIACEAIHSWLPANIASDPPIGATYIVTVRPLERLERVPLLRRRFKRAWDEFKLRAAEMLAVLDENEAAPLGRIPALLLDTPAALNRNLAATLAKRGTRCVVLREAPTATKIGQLDAVLDTPTPLIVWWQAGRGPGGIDDTMLRLLQSVSISDLPRRVREERAAAHRDESGLHPGMNLTLVWDDTDFLPPENDPQAKARLETT